MDFLDTPLRDVVDFLAELHQLKILVDERAISDIGLSPDEPVTLKVNDVTLRSGLNLLLEPRELDYVIKDEVLLITSREKADRTMETRVYNVARIPHLTPQELLEIIVGGSVMGGFGGASGTGDGLPNKSENRPADVTSTSTSAASNSSLIPDALWVEQDGEGGTAWAGPRTLIIRQNQRVHHAIVELLNQLALDRDAPDREFHSGRGSRNRGESFTPPRFNEPSIPDRLK